MPELTARVPVVGTRVEVELPIFSNRVWLATVSLEDGSSKAFDVVGFNTVSAPMVAEKCARLNWGKMVREIRMEVYPC